MILRGMSALGSHAANNASRPHPAGGALRHFPACAPKTGTDM